MLSMSEKYARVENYAQRKNKDITCIDCNYTVQIIHEDGSTFVYVNAFALMCEVDHTKFLIVFPEHMAYQVFCEEELNGYGQYQRVDIKAIEEGIV